MPYLLFHNHIRSRCTCFFPWTPLYQGLASICTIPGNSRPEEEIGKVLSVAETYACLFWRKRVRQEELSFQNVRLGVQLINANFFFSFKILYDSSEPSSRSPEACMFSLPDSKDPLWPEPRP